MSLDTKYRPLLFEEVLGQEGTIEILKKLIDRGEIFHKSYVFSGKSGTGKTTTARILARAMLCENLTEEGEPCNECSSCRGIIEQGDSPSFKEMDAANNSGKDDIKRILEELDYYTLDGKDRKIYLIDECHRLSANAMDALLKPMEDNVRGSQDKKLVCLFCTTEPNKLSTTLKTRCMMFSIQEPSEEDVVDRLSYICDEEGIPYEDDGLSLIYQNSHGHIREMVNLVEKISRTGSLTENQVRDQLGLETVSNFFRILIHSGTDLDKAFEILQDTLGMVDPGVVYNGLAEAALAAFRVSHGITTGMSYTDKKLAGELFDTYGENVLAIPDRILKDSRPVDENILTMELIQISRLLSGGTIYEPKTLKQSRASEVSSSEDQQEFTEDQEEVEEERPQKVDKDSLGEEAKEDASYISELGSRFVNAENIKRKEESSKEEVVVKSPDEYDIKPLPEHQLQSLYREIDD